MPLSKKRRSPERSAEAASTPKARARLIVNACPRGYREELKTDTEDTSWSRIKDSQKLGMMTPPWGRVKKEEC